MGNIYVDDINMLGEKFQDVRENSEIFIKASKNISIEVNSEKTKNMITSLHKNAVQNQNSIIIIRVFCSRAGHSLQTQEPRLQFCSKTGFPPQT